MLRYKIVGKGGTKLPIKKDAIYVGISQKRTAICNQETILNKKD